MNDKQLTAFISVVENGSFSSAARKQFISSQAMLQQIDLLEKEVGTKLLHRTYRGVTLTEAGKVFYEGSAHLLAELSDLLTRTRAAQVMQDQRLRIGMFDMSELMQTICESFTRKHPEITQEYTLVPFENWLSQLDDLRNGKLDIFEHSGVQEVYQNGLDFIPLIKSRIVGIVLPSHPLAAKTVLEPHDLAQMQVGIHDAACIPPLGKYLEVHAPGSTLIDGHKGAASALEICKSGGVFLVAEEYAGLFRPLRTVPFNCELRWTFGIAYRKNHSPLVQLFIDNAKAQFPQK